MSLRQRLLSILLALGLVLSGVLVTWTVWLGNTYERALEEERRARVGIERGRLAQVDFKIQVQEWKNVLLRGHFELDREKYWGQFEEREARVRAHTRWLVETLPAGEARNHAAAFIEAHAELGARYRSAYPIFQGDPTDPYRVDVAIRGIDRKPTETLDLLVESLTNEQVVASAATDRAIVATFTSGGIAVAIVLLAAVALVPQWLNRKVIRPMSIAVRVADRIAAGERHVEVPAGAPAEAGTLLAALDHLQRQVARAEREIEQRTAQVLSARQALAASEARQRFLGVVSHELRTPLHGIMGSLDVLRESHPECKDIDLVLAALSSAHRLMDLVEDVLAYTESADSSWAVELDEVTPRQVLDGLVDVCHRACRARDLVFDLSESPLLDEPMVTDAGRLRQVLRPLLSNAVKFTERGGVVVSVHRLGRMIVFEIRDTGPGLPDHVRENLGSPLVPGDESRSRRHEGIGLGLAIAISITARLGGELWLDDSGTGTVARVALPARDAGLSASTPRSNAPPPS